MPIYKSIMSRICQLSGKRAMVGNNVSHSNKKILNPIRDDGPEDHIIKKIGTPTMGGVIILCCQRRFLPLLQNFLNQSFWQPFAKLCYSAYLIHPCILIWFYCQQPGPVEFGNNLF